MDGPVARRKKSPYRQRPVSVPLFLAAWKVLVGCLCICLFLVAGKVLVGCLCIPSGGPAVDPATLLIEETDFPPGWKVCQSGRYRGNPAGAEEVVFVSFCFSESSVQSREELYHSARARGGEDIYRYCSEGRARWAWEHNVYVGETFPGADEWWQVPEEVGQIDIRADQWRIGCTDQWFRNEVSCMFRARYGEYLVVFGATMAVKEREVMTISEFVSILEKIDRKMVSSTKMPR